MVAGAAPAHALSCAGATGTVTLAWTGAGFARVSNTLATSTSGPLTVTATSTFFGSMQAATTNTNLTTHASPNGGTTLAALDLSQSYNAGVPNGTNAARQDVTFSFNCTVWNISFMIADIDSQNTTSANGNRFIDTVALSTTMTGSPPAGSTVVGAGTTASPWKQTAPPYANFADTVNTGNINVSNTGIISAFTLSYWNTHTNPNLTTGNAQHIYIGPFTVTYCC